MRLGIDISTYFDEIEHGAKYYNGKKEIAPLDAFRENGIDIVRIRVWVDPVSDYGEKYLGGDCTLENFLRLSKLVSAFGYKIMLDIHYSDFWVDPAKQTIPKAWQSLSFEGLVEQVYAYTTEILRAAKAQGTDIEFIQVGNEITNGMLWPYGKLTGTDGARSGYNNLVRLIKAGCRGCREVYPGAKIILHLEKSNDKVIYNEFFTGMQNAGVDFDIIGFSYYPYWHGTFAQFFENVEACKKFKKKLMVVEVGYAFTLEDYIKNEQAQLVVNEDNVAGFSFTAEYPVSPAGQAKFTKAFLSLSKKHGIDAVIWWEPLWIPGREICWASEAGQSYIGEEGKSTRNEWANQCLFDYEGRALPAFGEFKIKVKN